MELGDIGMQLLQESNNKSVASHQIETKMNYKLILLGLFVFEIVIGITLIGLGLFSNPVSLITVALGFSVLIAHVVELLMLKRIGQ